MYRHKYLSTLDNLSLPTPLQPSHPPPPLSALPQLAHTYLTSLSGALKTESYRRYANLCTLTSLHPPTPSALSRYQTSIIAHPLINTHTPLGYLTTAGHTWDGGRATVLRPAPSRPGLLGRLDALVLHSTYTRYLLTPRVVWSELSVTRRNKDEFFLSVDKDSEGEGGDAAGGKGAGDKVDGNGESGDAAAEAPPRNNVLTAIRRGDTFYVSHSVDFPAIYRGRMDVVPRTGVFAKLVVGEEDGHVMMCVDVEYMEAQFKDGGGSYASSDTKDIVHGVNGLCVMEGTQSMAGFEKVTADVRCVDVVVPNFGRTFEEGAYKGGEGKEGGPSPIETIACNNRLPTWNPNLKSLVLKFNNGRVVVASPKNFILTRSCHVTSNDPSDAVMQFGKRRKGVYAMDCKAPMSVLQAFGCSLMTFRWKTDEKEKEKGRKEKERERTKSKG